MRYKQLKDEQNQPFLPITGLDGVREGEQSLREILAELDTNHSAEKIVGKTHTIYPQKKILTLEGAGVLIIPFTYTEDPGTIYAITGTISTEFGSTQYTAVAGIESEKTSLEFSCANPSALPSVHMYSGNSFFLCFGKDTGVEGTFTIDYIVAPNYFEVVYPEGLTPLSELEGKYLREVAPNKKILAPVREELEAHIKDVNAHKELFDSKANLKNGVIVEHEIPAPIRSLTTKFSELYERVDRLSDQIDSVEDNDAVVKELREMMAGIQTSLTTMEEGLQQVELNKQEIATLDTALSSLESKLEELELSVGTLETTSNTHTSNITELYGKIDEINTSLDIVLLEILTDIDNRVLKTVYEEKIAEIEGIQATLDTKITELKTALGEIDIDLTGSINGVQWDGKEDITITAKADGGRADSAATADSATKATNADNSKTAGKADSANISNIIAMPDTRNVSDSPKSLSEGVTSAFKTKGSIGNPPVEAGRGYCYPLRLRGWHDTSGGHPVEIVAGDKGIAVRQGTSDTAWGGWNLLPFITASTGNPSGGVDKQVWLKYK